MAGVLALLRVCPAAHLLQAARGVPTLVQAQGLRDRRTARAERLVGAASPQRAPARSPPTGSGEHGGPRDWSAGSKVTSYPKVTDSSCCWHTALPLYGIFTCQALCSDTCLLRTQHALPLISQLIHKVGVVLRISSILHVLSYLLFTIVPGGKFVR